MQVPQLLGLVVLQPHQLHYPIGIIFYRGLAHQAQVEAGKRQPVLLFYNKNAIHYMHYVIAFILHQCSTYTGGITNVVPYKSK